MTERGPRAGWTFGGLGAILWLLILAAVLLYQHNFAAALSALAGFALALAYIIIFAPWKHPHTPFRRIYLGLVLIILVSAALLLYLWYPDQFADTAGRFSIFSIFPLFLPVFLFGKRTWSDIHPTHKPD